MTKKLKPTKRSTLNIDIECKMHEHLFMALFAGLTMVKKAEVEQTKKGMFSLVGAEAYSFIEDLKEQFPFEMEQAEQDTKHYYPELFKPTNND